MTVKIVTDSGSDLPADLAKALGITVVPVYVHFGNRIYRDGIDIDTDEFYRRLLGNGSKPPTTTSPLATDYARVYEELSKETDEILSIHMASTLSGSYNAALMGQELAQVRCETDIEVLDSQSISMGLGMLTVAAARIAEKGASVYRVRSQVEKMIKQVKLIGFIDTLKYLLTNGKMIKANGNVGGMLQVKPFLTMHDGEIAMAGMVRTYSKGLERIVQIIKDIPDIAEVAIVNSNVQEQAEVLKKKVSSFVNEDKIRISRISPGLGVHIGPNALIVAVKQSPS
jgi:DegV family protein with EDD domain